MRLFRMGGFLSALCLSLFAMPTLAAAAPLEVGAVRMVGSVTNPVDQTVDVLLMVSASPSVVRDRADDSQFGRARRTADTMATLNLTRTASPIAISPLEVGARLAGSVRAAG